MYGTNFAFQGMRRSFLSGGACGADPRGALLFGARFSLSVWVSSLRKIAYFSEILEPGERARRSIAPQQTLAPRVGW